MITKTEIFGQVNQNRRAREKIEGTLIQLQELKSKILKLRLQCEDLKKNLEHTGSTLLCRECGDSIEQSQEVIVRDSTGRESYYHMKCFKAFWV